MGWKVLVVLYWGLVGGCFIELVGLNVKNVYFIQIFSFFGKFLLVGEKVVVELKVKYFVIKGLDDIILVVGVVNVYDGMQLVVLVIVKVGFINGDVVCEGFYKIDCYEGLIKIYVKFFSLIVYDVL